MDQPTRRPAEACSTPEPTEDPTAALAYRLIRFAPLAEVLRMMLD